MAPWPISMTTAHSLMLSLIIIFPAVLHKLGSHSYIPALHITRVSSTLECYFVKSCSNDVFTTLQGDADRYGHRGVVASFKEDVGGYICHHFYSCPLTFFSLSYSMFMLIWSLRLSVTTCFPLCYWYLHFLFQRQQLIKSIKSKKENISTIMNVKCLILIRELTQ